MVKKMNLIRTLNLKVPALVAGAIALVAFVVGSLSTKPRCVTARPSNCSAAPTPTPTPTRSGGNSFDEIRDAFDSVGETLRCLPVKTCTPNPVLEPATWVMWTALLALLAVAALALWRRFGPQPTDTDTDTDTVVDGGDDGADPFAGYGAAGAEAYRYLVSDQAPTGTPAPGTSYPEESIPGYLVLGAQAQAQPQEPAPAPTADDALDFDALFGRGKD